MQRNKVVLLGAVSVVVAVAASFLFSAGGAQASLFENFLQRLWPGLPGIEAPAAPGAAAEPYRPAADYEERVVKAVENASPAVVSIVISKNVPIIEQCPFDPFEDLPPEFREFFGGGREFSKPCQKGTRLQEVGGGSGFIVSADGLIVTNKHVVLDTKAEYTVFTNDGKKYAAKVLARDPVLDIALIKIDAANLSTVPLGDSDSLRLGQTAIAIGNALGEFRNTVSVGVVSGLSRTITAGDGGSFSETIRGVLQTDAAINPGNSGGPLLNLKGEVIGINTAVVSGAQNIGFAIPVNQAKRAIESVKRTGKIAVPYLGVRYLLVTEELAEKEKLPVSYGALLRGGDDGPAIVKDSPAARDGLLAEDIVIKVNDQRVDRDHDLALLIQRYNVDDVVTLTVLRDGKELAYHIRLEELSGL
ncbi:MAG: trypsin-like peptidase domain-containing protein [Candidatus Liptonbacteria bacterium]|nr:trypsin-like peptidase domain-containing protein [Candidatus Liptonbacteria bacterium]